MPHFSSALRDGHVWLCVSVLSAVHLSTAISIVEKGATVTVPVPRVSDNRMGQAVHGNSSQQEQRGGHRGQGRQGFASVITLAELQSGFLFPVSPLDDAVFGLPADAAPPSNTFSGRVTLSETARIQTEILKDPYNYGAYASRRRLPPEFAIEYLTDGTALVPVQRGLVTTGDVVWNLVFSPGVVWDEPDDTDRGWTRAAAPFALSERNANCVHNGLLLFAFRSVGGASTTADRGANASSGLALEMTAVRFQITAETCRYFQATYWGQLPGAVYPDADTTPRFAAARAQYRWEVQNRAPVAPLTQLATDYPTVDPAAFGGSLDQSRVSARGVYARGTLYVAPCKTRTGGYGGHCANLVVPSYSTAKYIMAGMAIGRLAQIYGRGVYDELVSTWLPTETRAHPEDWVGVTFRHALDMSTGNYDSAAYQYDEDNDMGPFFVPDTYAAKMTAAFGFTHRVEPGTKHIYHTSDTFIVASAMQQYLKAKSGRDVWAMVIEDILVPLKVSSGSWTSLRTYDTMAQPYGGMGLWFTVDDVAKIATFLSVDHGAINGVQLLEKEGLLAGLQQVPTDRGLNADNPDLTLCYNHGMWAKVYRGADVGCPQQESFYQPYLSGFGGIRIVLLNNGVTYFYFSDGGEFEMDAAVVESNKIAPLCAQMARVQ